MKNAYAIVGLMFLIVFGTGYLLFKRAEAPEREVVPPPTSATSTSPNSELENL